MKVLIRQHKRFLAATGTNSVTALAHQEWFATIEVFGADIGAQIEARELPFAGITADSTKRGKDTIALILGRSREKHRMTNVTMSVMAVMFVRNRQMLYLARSVGDSRVRLREVGVFWFVELIFREVHSQNEKP